MWVGIDRDFISDEQDVQRPREEHQDVHNLRIGNRQGSAGEEG